MKEKKAVRVVYADILFAVNLSADFIVLYACGKVLSLKISFVRLFAAALIGTVFAALCETVFFDKGAICITLGVLCVPLMCRTAYKQFGTVSFIKLCGLFVFLSMLLGGGMESISYMLIKLTKNAAFLKDGLSIKMFVLLSGVMSAATICFAKLFKRSKGSFETKKVFISADGTQRYGFELMCDTGNVLLDPYSRLPVIVLKKENISYFKDALYSFKDSENIYFGEKAIKSHIRFVPAKSACGSTVFAAFKPASTQIVKDGKSISVDAVVAFDNGGCTYCGTDGVVPYELTENL